MVRRPPRHKVLISAILGSTLLVTAACGSTETTQPSDPSATSAPSATSKPVEKPDDSPIEFDRTVYYRGFTIELGTATFTGDKDTGQKMALAMSVENPFTDAQSFYADFALQDGNKEVASGYIKDTVKVLPGAKADATAEFSIRNEITSRKGLFLAIGADDEQQVKVPLEGDDGFEPRAPVKQTVPAAFPVGPLTFTPTTAVVAYSSPGSSHKQAPTGKMYVAIDMTVTNPVTYSIASSGVTLTPATGAAIAAEDLNQGTGTEEERKKVQIVFLVDEDYAGAYTLGVTATRPADAVGQVAVELKAAA